MTKLMTLLCLCVLAYSPRAVADQPKHADMMHEVTAATYEHLATAIIEIRKTEDNLVKGILMHHYALAESHLKQAAAGEGKSQLEAAAEEISNIAMEGDKRVQAIRQRLEKAGHHHHTDAETKEDYIFIDSKEKKALLDLAGRVAKTDPGSADAVNTLASELASTFHNAMMGE
jgi:hypothetical protein